MLVSQKITPNASKGSVQTRAQASHHGNDRYRNATGDQARFDGGCAGLIVEKAD
jgi:hypothetical protein